ncbi:MAG: hypothetical protein IK990_07810 [Ruminiclostridium sp.]|nr:hypothetical protein [Ruminiclostridium sp.]
MVTLNGIDYATNTAVFSISKAADITELPTTSMTGGNSNETFAPVKAGSLAYMTDGTGTKYVLDGDTDEWKEVQ